MADTSVSRCTCAHVWIYDTCTMKQTPKKLHCTILLLQVNEPHLITHIVPEAVVDFEFGGRLAGVAQADGQQGAQNERHQRGHRQHRQFKDGEEEAEHRLHASIGSTCVACVSKNEDKKKKKVLVKFASKLTVRLRRQPSTLRKPQIPAPRISASPRSTARNCRCGSSGQTSARRLSRRLPRRRRRAGTRRFQGRLLPRRWRSSPQRC